MVAVWEQSPPYMGIQVDVKCYGVGGANFCELNTRSWSDVIPIIFPATFSAEGVIGLFF